MKGKGVRQKKSNVKKKQATSGRKPKNQDSGHILLQLGNLFIFLWRPKLLLSIIVGAAVSIGYNEINVKSILPITLVKIEGTFKFLDEQQLRDKARPITQSGFFEVSLSEIRNLLEQQPWVEDVSIRREWPNKLLVKVIEKTPVVFWGKHGVISTKGELFVPGIKPDFNLPHLFGPEGQHKKMLQELTKMQAWLVDTGLSIANVELNVRRSWTLTMGSGLELRLGRKQIHERINRFVSVYEETLKIDKREIKYIDMRYTNGYSVAWEEA